jgi:Spy/CpxP family protein refolding chaperone
MKKQLCYAVGLAVILTVLTTRSGAWGADPGMEGFGSGGSARMERFLTQELGLSPEQLSELQAMRQKHFSETAPLRQKLFSRRQELRLLWADPHPDEAKITAKQKEIAEIQEQIQEAMTKHRLEALKVLTPEQKQKLSSFMQKRGFEASWGRRPRPWR